MGAVGQLTQWRTANGRNGKPVSFRELERRLAAAGIEASYATLQRIEAGEWIPNLTLAVALERLTGGAVRPEHFVHGPGETGRTDNGAKKLRA